MRKTLFGFGLAAACLAATGYAQQAATMNCKLFRVQTDQHQITVVEGNFQQSGAGGGGQDDAKAKRYTVKVNGQTEIKWEGGDRVTLKQLDQMSQRRLIIPMMVKYDKEKSDETINATAITLKGAPPQR